MEQAIIYGAGNTGRFAYDFLKQMYDITAFIDGNNSSKWGTTINGIKVCSPEILSEHRNTKVFIASIYANEILKEIRKYHLASVYNYEIGITQYWPEAMEDLNAVKIIDLGAFFQKQNRIIACKELTFNPGGSGVLDYMFIKAVAEHFHCKEYLEIGTYIGESINILLNSCEQLYSITAPLGSDISATNFCKELGIPDFSGRLTKDPRIIHYYADSKKFDYSQLSRTIDLFFIDGDHSYEGVYSDTRNIFSIKKETAIVIWHDVKNNMGLFNTQVLYAIQDALGSEFENFYITNNNMCGIYLPEKFQEEFPLVDGYSSDEDTPLYTYDVTIENCSIH